MAKVRVKVRPTGCINGREWPEVGGVIDLPDVVVESMGNMLEPVKDEPKIEKRPAPRKGAEQRKG